MLQLKQAFLNQPILSLRSGTQVATALRPIINPHNLKIEGFYCQDSISRDELILLPQDIREALPQGFVVNDHDVLVHAEDVVRLQKIIPLHYELVGKVVSTDTKQRLGKVDDYATDIESMFIQKIYVSQSLLRGLGSGNIGVDRSQIVEVTDRKVIVRDTHARIPANARALA
ncbi:MAG TPA: hypothetical protein VFI74_06070 [Candidatus Saccharimonadales bacterium]|nr:hypothetical protein [Candidatus Saccharimonadales bacterium]